MFCLIIAFMCFLSYEIGVFYYPAETAAIIQKTGWYSLKTYTLVDLWIQRLIYLTDQHVINNIKPLLLPATEKVNIALVYDGTTVKTFSLTEFNQAAAFPPYDFIVHEVCSDIFADKTLHMVIFNDYVSFKEKFSISKIKFLGIQLYISSNPLVKTSVVFGYHNFYVVNNTIFTQSFLKWYIKSATDIIVNETDKVFIEFIDHNMKCIKLKPTEYLVIGEDDYAVATITDEPSPIQEYEETTTTTTDPDDNIKTTVL